MPEGQQMSSGKKLIRKVKKGGASGMSKSDINAMALSSGGHVNLTGNAATTKGHHKNNMTLQQPSSGFSGPGAVSGAPTNSRVLSGNSNSAGAANIKSQTLKNYSSTQNLSKTGLNNIRLKQLV